MPARNSGLAWPWCVKHQQPLNLNGWKNYWNEPFQGVGGGP